MGLGVGTITDKNMFNMKRKDRGMWTVHTFFAFRLAAPATSALGGMKSSSSESGAFRTIVLPKNVNTKRQCTLSGNKVAILKRELSMCTRR